MPEMNYSQFTPNCTCKITQLDLAFFRFPWPDARSGQRINCRRADLEDKTPDQLNKHYRLCARHFETAMIYTGQIFDLTSHLNNSHKGGSQQDGDILPLTLEEKENRVPKVFFEILILMGKQNIPLDGHEADEIPEGLFTLDNFQALLECQINSGEEVLRKRFETTAVNMLFCSKMHCIREEMLGEVRDSPFFSILTDDVVDIAGEKYLPVLVRFVGEFHNLKEEFLMQILTVKFHTTITEMGTQYAYIVSSGFSSKMKVVASQLLAKYPQAVSTLCSSCALNTWLAKSVPVTGVSVALGTIEEVCALFHRSPHLLLELDNIISQGNELKEVCRQAGRHDTFKISSNDRVNSRPYLEKPKKLLQALVLCLDAINSDTNVRWNNCIAGRAFVLCSAVTDFDFIVTTVVLKNNLQGQTSNVFFAASSPTAVLHSLNEVMKNTEVYHEFWFEEATNLATKLDIHMKLPGKFHRSQQGNLESQLTSESYYKETLNVPTVEHIIQELKDIFSEQHLKALKCFSLVPSVIGQLKFNTSEEHHADMYKSDLPNPDTLSAELHCWRIKWKHKGKDIELPSTIYKALHLPDIKFFPNMYALLKVLCILPVMKVENERCENGQKHLKAYLKNTLTDQRSSNLVLLNINLDIKHNLNSMVGTYIKLYKNKSEFPTNNSEPIENT
uniref:HAT C-terminal dimerisation domain-containing protein n=1 Tax=Jaculus jaculus TaxID=51337 RepID=A0A8C5NUV8_JACJA